MSAQPCPCCDAERMGGGNVLALLAYGAAIGAVYSATGAMSALVCAEHRTAWVMAMINATAFMAGAPK